jgi:hypothetical protein
MESSEVPEDGESAGEGAEVDGGGPPVHVSTGRLTGAQAETVDRWRERLAANRPLPGRRRKDPMLALIGIDNRPPASCSDVIAAAVVDLLDNRPPGELEVARYAVRARAATRAAADSTSDDLPRFSPVSFYLPPDLADRYERLRVGAFDAVLHIHRELVEEAAQRYPDPAQADQARAWLHGQLHEHELPRRMHQVPRGVIARMAIDHWRRRSADRAVGDAVEYAVKVHDQPHRARRDMHQIRR